MQKKLKANRPVKPRTTEALTLEQVRALLTAAEGEMQTLVLLGATTGQSFRDLLALRWERVDMAKRVIRFYALKTLRKVVVPMTEELRAHLEQLADAGEDALVLPGLGKGNWTAIEQQFGRLVEKVGLRGTSFRALRVTFVHQLQMASTTPAEVMAVLAHVKGTEKEKGDFGLADVIAKLPPLK